MTDSSKPFDVEMIRGFLEYLNLALKTRHLQNAESGQIHPDLKEQHARMIKEHQTACLLRVHVAQGEEKGKLTQPEQEAVDRLRALWARQAHKELEALELLHRLLEEALACAAHPDEVTAEVINLPALLRNQDGAITIRRMPVQRTAAGS